MEIKISIVAEIERNPYSCDHRGLIQGLQELRIEYQIADPILYNPRILAHKIKEFKPDLVLHHMTNPMIDGLPKMLEGFNQIFWMLDFNPDTSEYQQWTEQGKYLKHIFLSNYDYLDWWKENFKVPTSYLPHGSYIPAVLEYDKKFRYPCVFMGSMINQGRFKPRYDLIEAINNKTPITIINSYDEKQRNENWRNTEKIYHSSDVVLDISHHWDTKGYASGRFFYSAGYGACCVTKRFPRCEELYPEGTKAYFDTAEEAVEKIKFYQTHKREREEMKRSAYEYAKQKHSYKLRWQKILEV